MHHSESHRHPNVLYRSNCSNYVLQNGHNSGLTLLMLLLVLGDTGF